jgi:RNA polymerase sigma-70 factor (ECF subfamily)
MPPWEQLETHLPRIYRFALRLTADSDWAEDLTQDTLLKAWKNRGQLRAAESARVWLFRITVNLWRDQVRQSGNRPVMEQNTESAVDRSPQPVEVLGEREELLDVLKAIERLPPRQREVLHLSAVEDLRIAEIAEVLGISANAVKVNLSEARKKMREAFPLQNPAPNSGKLP